jgi:hypothetical protein
MTRVVLLAFFTAEAAGFLPLYTYSSFRATFSGPRPRIAWWEWILGWGIWVFCVLCVWFLGREAIRRWRGLGRIQGTDAVGVVLVVAVGLYAGYALSVALLVVP